MWYSIIIIASLALVLLTAVTFLNIGLKLSHGGAQPVRLLPKFKRKPKISKEQQEWMDSMKKVDEFYGYVRSEGVINE